MEKFLKFFRFPVSLEAETTDPLTDLKRQLQRNRAALIDGLVRAEAAEVRAREHTRAFKTCIRACENGLSVINAHEATAKSFTAIQKFADVGDFLNQELEVSSK